MGDAFAGWAGLASIFVFILIVVVALLAFLMPIFAYNIRNEPKTLNTFMREDALPTMHKLDKNLELTTKLIADMRKRIMQK